MRFWAFCLWAEEYRFPDADRSGQRNRIMVQELA
jgi:hypothetical protein